MCEVLIWFANADNDWSNAQRQRSDEFCGCPRCCTHILATTESLVISDGKHSVYFEWLLTHASLIASSVTTVRRSTWFRKRYLTASSHFYTVLSSGATTLTSGLNWLLANPVRNFRSAKSAWAFGVFWIFVSRTNRVRLSMTMIGAFLENLWFFILTFIFLRYTCFLLFSRDGFTYDVSPRRLFYMKPFCHIAADLLWFFRPQVS